MKIFNDIRTVAINNPVATLGIFDGVHLAHRAIIARLIAISKNVSGESVVVTLWPHPRIVLNEDKAEIHLITTLEEKIELLENAGTDNLVILPFDKKMADTNFDDFVSEYLVKALRIHHLVVGFNHQFGRNREGNYEKLQVLSDHFGFELERLDPYYVEDEKVSSSVIRKLLISGNIAKANRFLGYPFYLRGKVTQGEQIGREIGFPTANIVPSESFKILPGNGVYAVRAGIKGQTFSAMMNIGVRPTINHITSSPVSEVHIFDFDGNLYNQEITIQFFRRIRDEKRFNSLAELKMQLDKDKKVVVDFFRDKH